MNDWWIAPTTASALHIARDVLVEVWRGRDRALDPVDALIIASVIHANIDRATAGLDDQIAYGGLNNPPPAALRRPTSIKGVAQSLGLPFETVRRRLKGLAEIGLMELDARGVLVPEAYFYTAGNQAAVLEMDDIAARMYRRLNAVGFFDGRPLPPPGRRPSEHPYRAVARFFMSFALRLGAELRPLCGDYLDLLLIMHMTQINTSEVGDARAGAPGAPATTVVSDGIKSPASVAALSRAAELPFETVRRRVHRLTDRGVCAAVEGGYLVPAETFAAVAKGLADVNEMNLLRLYRNCALVGALERWDAAGTALAEAATAS